MDLDHIELRDNVGFRLVGCNVVATFHKVALPSCKAVLAAKKEANCRWCDDSC